MANWEYFLCDCQTCRDSHRTFFLRKKEDQYECFDPLYKPNWSPMTPELQAEFQREPLIRISEAEVFAELL